MRPLATVFAPSREGDIMHSLADISLAQSTIGYHPKVQFLEGLRRTFDEFTSA
jgi:nucleoside-diphosphate-sugar epimerase